MSERTRLKLCVLCALVCGLLTGAAAVLWLGCPAGPPAAPASQSSYSSSYGSSGTGCWTESKADGDAEKICGATSGRPVSA